MAKQLVVLPKPLAAVHTLQASDSRELEVKATKEGSVTWLDKAKGYYKALIALVGALLIGATQLSGAVPAEIEPWVTVAISAFTTLGVVLRANEVWVNAL